MESTNSNNLEKVIAKLRIESIKRHIFLCIGDKCCSQEEGIKTWEFLKERCRQEDSIEAGIYRTKVGCLRICQQGPIALVYPEGTWYRQVSVDVCKRIVDEHLLKGRVVEEYKIAEHALHPFSEDSIVVRETP